MRLKGKHGFVTFWMDHWPDKINRCIQKHSDIQLLTNVCLPTAWYPPPTVPHIDISAVQTHSAWSWSRSRPFLVWNHIRLAMQADGNARDCNSSQQKPPLMDFHRKTISLKLGIALYYRNTLGRNIRKQVTAILLKRAFHGVFIRYG